MLRKWPHKSDRETHLWMPVKVLLLITSKVSEAEGGSGKRSLQGLGAGVSCLGIRGGDCLRVETATAPCGAFDPHVALGPPGWGTAPALSPAVKRRWPPPVPVSSRSPRQPIPVPLPWSDALSPLGDGPKWALHLLSPSRQPLSLLPRGLFLFGDPQCL